MEQQLDAMAEKIMKRPEEEKEAQMSEWLLSQSKLRTPILKPKPCKSGAWKRRLRSTLNVIQASVGWCLVSRVLIFRGADIPSVIPCAVIQCCYPSCSM